MSLTGKTGKYQNEINDLKGLGVGRYERSTGCDPSWIEGLNRMDMNLVSSNHSKKIFSEAKEGKEFYFYNLLNKIEFPSNIDSSLLDTYIVQGREPLTTTSFNIYGNIQSWWLLFLMNKEILNSRFYVEGGDQLEYILPSKVDLIYQQITKSTVFNNKHF